MKKLLLITLGFVPFMNSAYAQNFFLKTGAGYGFVSAGQGRNVNGFPYSGSATFLPSQGFTTYEIKDVSFASGAQVIIGGCYMFNNTLGLELDANFVIAPNKNSSRNKYPTSNSSVDERYTIYADKPVFITPSLYFQSNLRKNLGIYARGGVCIPAGVKVIGENTAQLTDQATGTVNNYYIEEEYRTVFNIGFSGATGLKYEVAPFVNIWMEGSLQSLSLNVDESTITQFVFNGQNMTNQVQNRTTAFKASGNASTQPTFSFPFSSMSLNLGVSFDF